MSRLVATSLLGALLALVFAGGAVAAQGDRGWDGFPLEPTPTAQPPGATPEPLVTIVREQRDDGGSSSVLIPLLAAAACIGALAAFTLGRARRPAKRRAVPAQRSGDAAANGQDRRVASVPVAVARESVAVGAMSGEPTGRRRPGGPPGAAEAREGAGAPSRTATGDALTELGAAQAQTADRAEESSHSAEARERSARDEVAAEDADLPPAPREPRPPEQPADRVAGATAGRPGPAEDDTSDSRRPAPRKPRPAKRVSRKRLPAGRAGVDEPDARRRRSVDAPPEAPGGLEPTGRRPVRAKPAAAETPTAAPVARPAAEPASAVPPVFAAPPAEGAAADLTEWDTCRIKLQSRTIKSHFYAVPYDGGPVLARSPYFKAARGDVDAGLGPAEALRTLVDHLVAAGWVQTGAGRAPWDLRFERGIAVARTQPPT